LRKLTAFAALLCAAQAAYGFTYFYSRAGTLNNDYHTPERVYQQSIGSYIWGAAPHPPFVGYAVDEHPSELAISPFGCGARGDLWRAAIAGRWSRNRVSGVDSRRVSITALEGCGDFVFNTGHFEGRQLKPYAGMSVRGVFSEAERVNNGVLTLGFGPEVGAVLDYTLNRSFMVVYFGFLYNRNVLTGRTWAEPVGDDPPAPPFYNYTYIPADRFPASSTSYYTGMDAYLEFAHHFGAQVEVRYTGNVERSFVNGFTFLAGPAYGL
jgi:hypothetical protein